MNRAVFENGQLKLKWKFWKKQKQALKHFYSENYDIVNFRGGYRSGKSITGARAIIEKALTQPGTDNVALGVDFQKAKKTTYKVLFDQLPGQNLDPYNKGGDPENSPVIKAFSKQDKNIVVQLPGHESSTITLGSADKGTRYEGGRFDYVWMDEPGLYGPTLYDVMDTFNERSRTQLWTSTGKIGAYKDIIEHRKDKDGQPLNLKIVNVKASTLDNPFIPEAKKQKLKRSYRDRKNEDMALHGGWGAVEGRVYPQFNRETHVKKLENIRIDPGFGRVYAYDAGWKDPRVLIEACKTPSGQIAIIDCFYREQSYVEDVIEWLQKKNKIKGRIFCEHEPGDIQKFRSKLGWKALKAEKDISEGITEVRNRFELDQQGRPGLIVAENCQKGISELLSYREEDVGGTNTNDHFCDCLRYLLMGLKKQGSKSKVSVSSVRAI